jgi:hypothetical protein
MITPPGDHERALHAPYTHRPPVVAMTALLFGLGLSLAAVPASAQPRLDDVEDSLLHDPSYKVRVEAVVAALRDPVPTVRHLARDALRGFGGMDDSTPHDPGEPGIRRRSAGRLAIEVRPVGDPSHHAGPLLKSHMRDFLVEQLRPLGDVSANGDVDETQANYAVGGVIKHLSFAQGGPDVEVTCAVQLVVMRQPGNALFLMTSGEAHVQKSKRTFRPQLQATMELQAVESAVRGASQDLIAQLGR